MGYSKFKKRKEQGPWSGTMLLQMPDGAERRVKLPSVSDYEIGEKIEVTADYKGLPYRIPLVRVEGGWEICENERHERRG